MTDCFDNNGLLRQPATSIHGPQMIHTSQAQLLTEVKGIYDGLVMVEPRCNETVRKRASATLNHEQWQASRRGSHGHDPRDFFDPASSIKEPETHSASQEQLVTEVKVIYTGLAMVESRCTEVGENQKEPAKKLLDDDQWQALIALHRTLLHEHHDFFLASQHPSDVPALKRLAQKLPDNDQWQALIALHRALLHEHHDFFLASQHPSAAPALRPLASKYAMPARMWRHGIHAFLEILRHRLPESLEHMLTFIYLAYSMMAALVDTVLACKDTWIECIGDLGRYRMAIEDEDIKNRETWTAVARNWYSDALEKATAQRRLYHHLAILTRPNAFQQSHHYYTTLCVAIPFRSTRETTLSLFKPLLPISPRLFVPHDHDENFIPPAWCAEDDTSDDNSVSMQKVSFMGNHIAQASHSWRESGSFIATANSRSCFEFSKSQCRERRGSRRRASNRLYNICHHDSKNLFHDPSTFRVAIHEARSCDEIRLARPSVGSLAERDRGLAAMEREIMRSLEQAPLWELKLEEDNGQFKLCSISMNSDDRPYRPDNTRLECTINCVMEFGVTAASIPNGFCTNFAEKDEIKYGPEISSIPGRATTRPERQRCGYRKHTNEVPCSRRLRVPRIINFLRTLILFNLNAGVLAVRRLTRYSTYTLGVLSGASGYANSQITSASGRDPAAARGFDASIRCVTISR